MRHSKVGILTIGILAAFATGCETYEPGPGEEIVVIDKPWLFGEGGVKPETVKTGLQYDWPSTEGVTVSVLPQRRKVPFDDLMSSENIPLDFEASIQYKITDPVKLVSKFGKDWYENNVDAVFQRLVREAVQKHTMSTMSAGTAIAAIDKDVTEALSAYIKGQDLPVALIEMTVGRANPPDQIKNQRIETATQDERKNTENSRKNAEQSRKDAEEARAAADNAYRQQMQLSPHQFIELERVKMQREVCAGGKCQFFVGAPGPSPVVNVGQ